MNRRRKLIITVALPFLLMVYLSEFYGHRFNTRRTFSQPTKNKYLPSPIATPTFTDTKQRKCWDEVNWGARPELPTQGATRACSVKQIPDGIYTKQGTCCVWPKGMQIHPKGLLSISPLSSVKEDGAGHNPVYPLEAGRVSYDCQAGALEDKQYPCGVPKKQCTRHFGETLMFRRKDDHNPYFMVDLIFNNWLMYLESTDLELLMFDDAGVKPTDGLFRKMLSPTKEITYAHEILDDIWCFDKLWEIDLHGPMTAATSCFDPCYNMHLFKTFADQVHEKYPDGRRDDPRTTVTIVGRRNYNGRLLHRVWTNEEEVVQAMNVARPDLYVRVVYYEDIDWTEQMRIDRTTEVMVGMHGAGLVHGMFLPPKSRLIELFPKDKRRFNVLESCIYHDFSDYLGFDYHEYRGGTDSNGDKHWKTVQIDAWMKFWNSAVPVGANPPQTQMMHLNRNVT